MWLRFANNDIIIENKKEELSEAIKKYGIMDDSLPIETLERNLNNLSNIIWSIYRYFEENKIQYQYSIIRDALNAKNDLENFITVLKGRTIYDRLDVYSIYNVINEKIQHSELSSYDVSRIIEDINKLLNYGIETKEYLGSGRYRKIQLSHSEKEILKLSLNILTKFIFNKNNIDLQKISDQEHWSVISEDNIVKTVEGNKVIPGGQDSDEEYPIITFIIDKKEGISILCEVGEVSQENYKLSFDFQKDELDKFLKDIEVFPNDWNKNITEVSEEGDIGRILKGSLNSNVKLFRMMSIVEYNKWVSGEVIPPGKYFATKRKNATGTDFGNEGDREIFTFISNNSLFRGDFDGNLVSIEPLILDGNRLIKKR
jgi:hypothetical protein